MEAERLRTEEAAHTDTALNRIEPEGVVVPSQPIPYQTAGPAMQPSVSEILIQKPLDSKQLVTLASALTGEPNIELEPVNSPKNSTHTQVSVASPTVNASQTAEAISARWFTLNSIFPANVPAPVHERGRVPAMAVFSLAGGVGKSSIVAALGRALSANGEHVLLVDTAAFGMLPFFYGAKDQRPDVLRTFVAPDSNGESRVEVLALEIDRFGPEGNTPEPFTKEILRHAAGVSRIVIDLATASSMIVRRILRMSPLVLVPVLPDVGSVASVGAIEQFFQRNSSGTGQPIQPFYIFNQFDENLRLHRDVREVLRNRLGDRLLHFSLRSSSLVGEALAEGMTTLDYAPDSPITDDYLGLAEWAQNLVAPSARVSRGARWSEQ
jgi:cellulose synthase operon protein YhjQ